MIKIMKKSTKLFAKNISYNCIIYLEMLSLFSSYIIVNYLIASMAEYMKHNCLSFIIIDFMTTL